MISNILYFLRMMTPRDSEKAQDRSRQWWSTAGVLGRRRLARRRAAKAQCLDPPGAEDDTVASGGFWGQVERAGVESDGASTGQTGLPALGRGVPDASVDLALLNEKRGEEDFLGPDLQEASLSRQASGTRS